MSGNNLRRSLFRLFFDCHERLIRIVECEYCNVRADIEVIRELEKIARILAGHISETAYLPFAPEQRVVVEGRPTLPASAMSGRIAANPRPT